MCSPYFYLCKLFPDDSLPQLSKTYPNVVKGGSAGNVIQEEQSFGDRTKNKD